MRPSPLAQEIEPTRETIDAMKGMAVLEFGAGWCPICQAAQPLIAQALGPRPDITHIKIEDGKGRRLGRTYRVKLWPTLIFLRDGVEVSRLVRPDSLRELGDTLLALSWPEAQ